MGKLEFEIRSYITKYQYGRLLKLLTKEAQFIKKEKQTTIYFDTKEDLRLQQGEDYAKIWLKGGKIHDEARVETEIFLKKEDFNKTLELFEKIGIKTKIKWLRKRYEFKWQAIKVYLDYTKGYGYIIELEKHGNKNQKKEIVKKLKEKLLKLDVNLTPRKIFEEKLKIYQKNWKKINKGIY